MPPESQVPPESQLPPAPAFGAGQAGAGTGGEVALAAPNMLGNLLGAGNSVTFFYQRTHGSVSSNGTGSTNVVNPSIADDNSPIPQDRVSFRYNYFNDSLKVTGDSGNAVFDPSLGLSAIDSSPRFKGITQTKSYDVHDFTFSGEKTFFDGRASIEMRVPFTTTLGHNQDLSVARVSSIGPDNDGDMPRASCKRRRRRATPWAKRRPSSAT